MKHLLTLLTILAVCWIVINNLTEIVVSANQYKYKQTQDSIAMYRDCCLRCNSHILETNEKFSK